MPNYTITISTALETFMNAHRLAATIEVYMANILDQMRTASNDGTVLRILHDST